MIFKNVSLIDENMELKDNMYLGTVGSKIAYIGATPPAEPEKYGECYARSGSILLVPGFFNAHTHMPMTLMRGYGENLSLMDWLNTRIFPFEDKMTLDDAYYSCMLNIAEMLRFGIVSASDMYMFCDSIGRAFVESGAKANISRSAACMDDRSYFELPAYREALEIMRDYNGAADGRVRTDFSLHAEYTSTEKVAREISETAAKYGTGLHVHVCETQGEVDACRERHGGRSPVRYLADCGAFDVPATAAHSVFLDDEDIEIYRQKKVSVATCPKSNLKLASGVCPASKLVAAGVNVAIGTDSVASNNNLNMLEEIKFYALLHKGIFGDPTAVTPSEALYAATRAGAIAQRREDCGLLKEGFCADIAVFDTDRIYMRPAHNMLNNLVYSACGTDVVTTMVDGKVLYDNGEFKTIDVEKITASLECSRQRILGELAN